MNIKDLAKTIDTAAVKATAVEQLTLQSKFSEQDAYAIQAASLERRYKRGEKLIGIKMGFTSVAKMKQMGVHDMIWGRLTDTMLMKDGSQLDFNNFIHPRAEPELCFLVKKTIDHELTFNDVGEYIEAVAPAIEIIDSRFKNFKFSLEDVIADNCSSAGLVVGKWQSHNMPLGDLKIELEINGKVVHSGSSKDILGDPWKSVLAATRLASQYEQVIAEGSYLMAGAATPAVYLKEGDRVGASVAYMNGVSFFVG